MLYLFVKVHVSNILEASGKIYWCEHIHAQIGSWKYWKLLENIIGEHIGDGDCLSLQVWPSAAVTFSFAAMSIQRRVSPDPSLSVRDLAGPLKAFMKERNNYDLAALVKPKQVKTSWKTSPDIEWMCQVSGLFVEFAKVCPNLCMASTRLKKAIQSCDEDLHCNKTKMSQGDWADKVDVWLRIVAAQFRATKKRYIATMKKAGDSDKEKIDAVLDLVEDQDAPAPGSKSAGSVVELVPFVPQPNSLAQAIPKSNQGSSSNADFSIFKRILEKQDSAPSEPAPVQAPAQGPKQLEAKGPTKAQKLQASQPADSQRSSTNVQRMGVDLGTSVLDKFLAQKPKDPILATPKKKSGAKDKCKGKKKSAMKEIASKANSIKKAGKPMKAVKKTSVMKKTPMKAAKQEAKDKDEAKTSWTMMFYKNSPAYAVRKKGGAQLFQITTLNKNPSKVRGTCEEAMKKLEGGESPTQVKSWAKSQTF